MSDWDFLHEMRNRGYSSADIADAAGVGYAPWQEAYVSREWVDDALADVLPEAADSLQPREAPHGPAQFPGEILRQMDIFEDLVDCAERHFENTGRYLQVWGELGKLYAEIKFGLRRHPPHQAGSDGTIDGRLVEVKTVSPEKQDDLVVVKRQGDFEQLLIVGIDAHFRFKAKLIEREELLDSGGKFYKVRLRGAEGRWMRSDDDER